MERRGGSSVANFFVQGPLAAGAVVPLPEAAAQHARVRRLAAGHDVRLIDGAGAVALGTLAAVERREVTFAIAEVQSVAPPAPLTLLVPVADRERMLWLAEKAAELAVTEWRPVIYARSRSVSPRGEGAGFAAKVRARMVAALEQSGGAWLPGIHEERFLDDAIGACRGAVGVMLDPGGAPLPSLAPFGALAVAIGPEGGFEAAEREALDAAGWRRASLGRATLRFETAGVAAAAIVRAAQG
ncbi:MAG: 16S rRNA (uracil(1498)-N(3))-methyltransferase [Gemmatimonadota bacterium]|nr:16S rRNA (uracil(1498)-N(3))-methyltransferase [Gemmatimonadota bacterium]